MISRTSTQEHLANRAVNGDLLSAEELRHLLAEAIERSGRLEDELHRRDDDLKAFSHTISHDLRAPIRAMRGFGEALLEDYGDQLDEVAKDFINRIVEAAEQMDVQIQDILARSRMDNDASAATAANPHTNS